MNVFCRIKGRGVPVGGGGSGGCWWRPSLAAGVALVFVFAAAPLMADAGTLRGVAFPGFRRRLLSLALLDMFESSWVLMQYFVLW